MIGRLLVQVVIMVLPWGIRRRLLVAAGFRIDAGAKIGLSLLLAEQVVLESQSRIGHFNTIRGLRSLRLGRSARIGNFNEIVGAASISGHYAHLPDRDPSLVLGEEAAITHRHLIDCTDAVTIGAFTTLAGWGTQILTHGIDVAIPRQEAAPVRIGSHVFLGTRCVLLKGAIVPSKCVIAAGAVVTGPLGDEAVIYGGVPAKKVGEIDPGSGYFTRDIGYVQ